MGKTMSPVQAKRPGRVGLRKVAEVAGVSTATVSRAMNAPGLVSAELRERIASVVERLGWVPDGAARALATRRTNTIGAIFPTLTHGDFARAIEGLQDELTRAGYTLLLACSEYDIDQEYRQARKLVERGSDAILLVGELHHHAAGEQRRGWPPGRAPCGLPARGPRYPARPGMRGGDRHSQVVGTAQGRGRASSVEAALIEPHRRVHGMRGQRLVQATVILSLVSPDFLLVEGLVVEKGFLLVPTRLGHGVEFNQDAWKRYRVG